MDYRAEKFFCKLAFVTTAIFGGVYLFSPCSEPEPKSIAGFEPAVLRRGAASNWPSEMNTYEVQNYPEKGQTIVLVDALGNRTLDEVLIFQNDSSLPLQNPESLANSWEGVLKIDDSNPTELEKYVALFNAVTIPKKD